MFLCVLDGTVNVHDLTVYTLITSINKVKSALKFTTYIEVGLILGFNTRNIPVCSSCLFF